MALQRVTMANLARSSVGLSGTFEPSVMVGLFHWFAKHAPTGVHERIPVSSPISRLVEWTGATG